MDKVPDGDKRRGAGRRMADQAGRNKPKHWLAIQASRHPVGVALIVAIAVAMIPLLMVLDQQGTIRRQTHRIDQQQIALNALIVRTQKGRAATSSTFCRTINANGRANNKQNDVLQSIILKSVKSSKPFDKLYRSFGLPPYSVRLHQAHQLAAQLEAAKVEVLPCAKFVKRIENELKAQPPVRAPAHIPPNKK